MFGVLGFIKQIQINITLVISILKGQDTKAELIPCKKSRGVGLFVTYKSTVGKFIIADNLLCLNIANPAVVSPVYTAFICRTYVIDIQKLLVNT